MKTPIPILSAALCTLVAFTSCETPGESALAGAASGAAIGGLATGRGHGALTGAAIGAGAGYLLGKIAQHERRAGYEEASGYDDTYYDDQYPIGQRTNRYGFVTSPYRPYNLIDVRGIPRGAKVVDPSRDRIFINP